MSVISFALWAVWKHTLDGELFVVDVSNRSARSWRSKTGDGREHLCVRRRLCPTSGTGYSPITKMKSKECCMVSTRTLHHCLSSNYHLVGKPRPEVRSAHIGLCHADSLYPGFYVSVLIVGTSALIRSPRWREKLTLKLIQLHVRSAHVDI